MKKIIAANMPYHKKEYLCTLLLEDNKPVDIDMQPLGSEKLVGNIYLGKVDRIQKNLQAAFVRYAGGQIGYLPINFDSKEIRVGDEFPVQITVDAIKMKQPRLDTNLKLTGKYMVLTKNGGLNFSRKLPGPVQRELKKKFLRFYKGAFGCIVRTNAAEAGLESLQNEYAFLARTMEKICKHGKERPAYSCLYRTESMAMIFYKSIASDELEGLITDNEDISAEFACYQEGNTNIQLYHDPLLPLYKLYSIEDLLQKLHNKQVWIKSGGFLYIEQTEACTVIDINSGKYIGKKDKNQTALLINSEACHEIAVQIRLRQLSGIILVDFINMEKEENRQWILQCLREELKKDPVRTEVVDMTALQIGEITRQKSRRSLLEQLT